MDSTFKAEGVPCRRFYLWRIEDETGISRTGRVLEGVLMQSGQVIVEWRPPLTSVAIYKDLDTFLAVHVTCHPSKNEVRWLDAAPQQEGERVTVHSLSRCSGPSTCRWPEHHVVLVLPEGSAGEGEANQVRAARTDSNHQEIVGG